MGAGPCAVRWALTCGLTHAGGHASREGDGIRPTPNISEKGPPHLLGTSAPVLYCGKLWNVAPSQHDGILSAHDAAVVLGYHKKHVGKRRAQVEACPVSVGRRRGSRVQPVDEAPCAGWKPLY
jgi:hypothetical protein